MALAQDVIAKLEQQNRLEADGMARPLTGLSSSSGGPSQSPLHLSGYMPMHASGRPTSRGLPAHGASAPEHSPGSVSVASLHPSSTNSPRALPQPYAHPSSHYHVAPRAPFPGPPPPPPPASSSLRRGDWGPTLPSPSGHAPMSIGAWLPPRLPYPDHKRPHAPSTASSKDGGGPESRSGSISAATPLETRRSPSVGQSSASARETPRSASAGGGFSLPPLSSLLRGGQTRPAESDERDAKRVRYVA